MLTEDLLRAVAATPRIDPPARHATAIVATNVDDEAAVTVIAGVNRVGSAANRALALRREVPAARIALATEVITDTFDRDALIARARMSLPAHDGDIALDEATRRLLDTGFVIRDDVLVREVAFAPGDRLAGRYEIIELVGEGGMGAVYRAIDEKLGLQVALKLVRGTVPDAALRDEVRLAQKVTHPNVCRTYDLEEIDGNHVIKMEYVAGATVAARLRRGPIGVKDTVRIVRAVAEGLAAAHAQGVVHRDVKPENIMLADGRVVLMDFGVAHSAGVAAELGGTLGYMAPEVVAGGEVDERADLFALGCVLAELVGDARRGVPRWVRHTRELLRDRDPARRVVGLRRLRRGPRRWPLLAVPGGLALAALAWLVFAGGPWAPHVLDFPAFEENCDTVSISPDGRWFALDSDRSGPEDFQIYMVEPHTGAASRFTTRPGWRAARPRWTRDGRALLYTATQVVCDGRPCEKLADGHILRQPVNGAPPSADGPPTDLGTGDAFDDCGDALAVVEMRLGGWRLMLQQQDGSRRELVAPIAGEFISSPSCSPEGNEIAFVRGRAWETSGNDVFVVDRQGALVQLTNDHVTRAVTWNPDGSSLFVVRDDQLYEMPSAGGEPEQIMTDAGRMTAPVISQDGNLLAYIRDDGAFFPVIYSETGEPKFLTRQRGIFWFVRPANEETAIAQRAHGGGWDVVALRLRDGTITNLGPGWLPFPARDGKRAYFGSPDAPGTLFVAPLAGGTRTAVAQLPAPLSYGNDEPDGQHVLVATGPGTWGAYHVGLDGRVEAEQRVGLVSVAPQGGWRAISVPKPNSDQFEVTLDLVPPGQPLDKPVRSIQVVSIYNEWLDDHRLGYCVPQECQILDVTNGAVVWRRPGIGDLMSAIAPDGRHVYGTFGSGHVTQHLVTNFGDR